MTTSRDELTPFVENYTDVFVKHVLSRVIIPSRCCRCRDAPEDAVPTNFVWCLVLRATCRERRTPSRPTERWSRRRRRGRSGTGPCRTKSFVA